MDELARDSAPASTILQDIACARCGYNLRGLDRGGKCPECGADVAGSFQRIEVDDPDWLRRLLPGVQSFYFLAFLGVCCIDWLMWWDLTFGPLKLVKLAASVGSLLAVWRITVRRGDETPGDPQAWPQRGARAAAVAMLLAAAGQVVAWGQEVYEWQIVDLLKPEQIRLIFTGALAACVILTLLQLSRIAGRLSLRPVAASLPPLSWVAAACLLPVVIFNAHWINAYEVSDAMVAVWYAAHLIAPILGTLAWLAILLLVGRLHERIREALSASSAPLPDGRPFGPVMTADPRPRDRFSLGIILAGVLLLNVHNPFRGMVRFVLGTATMLAYLGGIWLLMRSVATASERRERRLKVLGYISMGGLALGVILSRALQLTAGDSYPSPATVYAMGVATVLVVLAFPACTWACFALLVRAAVRVGNEDLRRSLRLHAWFVPLVLLVVDGITIVLPISPGVFELLTIAMLLVVVESIAVLGRSWHASEGRRLA